MLARHKGTGHMSSMCRPVLVFMVDGVSRQRVNPPQSELWAFNAEQSETMALQLAVMVRSHRGNEEGYQGTDEQKRAHCYGEADEVQTQGNSTMVQTQRWAVIIPLRPAILAHRGSNSGSGLRWKRKTK